MVVFIRDVVGAIDAIAPFSLAEPWDNVGLLIGRPDAPATKALLTIDLSLDVVDEAIALGCDVVIAYHPPLFRPIKRIVASSPGERAILTLIERGIAVISPHTALDAAPGGLNDWIAAGIGAGDVRALQPHASVPATEETKIVTYCPAGSVERLRDGLSTIGAGRIGASERCSFEIAATGTAAPAERPGQLTRTDHVRLEMVCPRSALALAIETIRQFHPHNEPVIELHALEKRPERGCGAGRRLTLDAPLPIESIAARLRELFGVTALQFARADGAPALHTTVGIAAGSGASLGDAAVAQGCSLFVTGELKHHEALSLAGLGCSVLLAGHTNTERGYLQTLATVIESRLKGFLCVVSCRDHDPFTNL
ncbi:MAG: Nif3-like dinuclear metal center hexameric protein [Phycisphaerae bacterium]|nr:Nif3-like dinuclear metal center hexameric protein [Phycisphaerae bacterium]